MIGQYHFVLFAFKRLYRIGQSRFYGLKTNRQEGDGDGQNARCHKHPPLNVNAVGKIGEPLLHKIPRNRRSNGDGDDYQFQKVFCQQTRDARHARAQYLADAYFLGAAFGSISGQTKQTEAGDENGQQREKAKNPLRTEFTGIKCREVGNSRKLK